MIIRKFVIRKFVIRKSINPFHVNISKKHIAQRQRHPVKPVQHRAGRSEIQYRRCQDDAKAAGTLQTTCDPLHPMQVLYQAELRPDNEQHITS